MVYEKAHVVAHLSFLKGWRREASNELMKIISGKAEHAGGSRPRMEL